MNIPIRQRVIGIGETFLDNFRKTHIDDIPHVMENIEENMRLANIIRGSMEDFGYLYNLTDADANNISDELVAQLKSPEE